jgi:hypothetical protein
VSGRLHTLLTIFTRAVGRFWTSCDQKRLKYSANEGISREERRNRAKAATGIGLKIAVLAIFLLFKIDQIEPNLPG